MDVRSVFEAIKNAHATRSVVEMFYIATLIISSIPILHLFIIGKACDPQITVFGMTFPYCNIQYGITFIYGFYFLFFKIAQIKARIKPVSSNDNSDN